MTKKLKIALLIYGLVSAISFYFLILAPNAGVSAAIFASVQLGCLFFIVPERKKLVWFVPIFLLCFNFLISSNDMWHIPNFVLCIVLYACMFTTFNLKDTTLVFMHNIVNRVFEPFENFGVPFNWMQSINSDKAPIIKKMLLAIVCAIPCVVLLVIALSGADMVFNKKLLSIFDSASDVFSVKTFFHMIWAVFAGFYLFGSVYCAHTQQSTPSEQRETARGDLIIINTILTSILFVYTVFVIIQFKYLFAGATLPEGLTYSEYARKGFFELLGLSFVNIAVIVCAMWLTSNHDGVWKHFNRMLCCYLCLVTVVLLVSSFYRMTLYTDSYGLTRLRLLVMGFLVFEAAGLAITFMYIIKPKFNICLVYMVIGLVYYSIINIVPIDNIIAKNHIQKHLEEGTNLPEYVFTLSADAAPSIKYLYENTNDDNTKNIAEAFLSDLVDSNDNDDWRSYNLSVEKCKRILDEITK